MSIYAELMKVMKVIEQPTKDTAAHKYKYAKLENVILAVKKAVISSEANLWFSQSTTSTDKETTCKTMLFNSEGETLEFNTSLQAKSSNPQESGSAKSYLKRYALLEIFSITPIGEQDDGEIFMVRGPEPKISHQQVVALEERLARMEINEESFSSWLHKSFKVSYSNLGGLTVPQYNQVVDMLNKRDSK